MKKLTMFFALIMFYQSQALANTSKCLSQFEVESIQFTKTNALVGIVKRHKEHTKSVIAYTEIDTKDSIFEGLKLAYLNEFYFEACMDAQTVSEIEKMSNCKTCTARGEIQNKIKLQSVGFLSPKSKIQTNKRI